MWEHVIFEREEEMSEFAGEKGTGGLEGDNDITGRGEDASTEESKVQSDDNEKI